MLEISADNSESFSTDELSAPAGTVTVTFDNQEDGVTHNWALYPSPDELDNQIAATELITGPATDSVTFTVEPGEYYFRCDVHPQMEGTFTAE
ncbi:MAG TPA: cupredoxin domain-containing protein, partial [Dehalococcoidia bacterium]|nr:cupredoxin domain-containing protein [Dehalococcoidia bacterium]